MNLRKLSCAFLSAALLVSSVGQSVACTSLMITDGSGRAYHARTMEFPGAIPSSITYIPAGTKVESSTPDNKQGKTFNTAFAILSVAGKIVPDAKMPLIYQGMNEQGLSLAANALFGPKAPPVGNDPAKILSTNDFGTWVLGNFKTVDEVKAAILSNDIEFWSPNIPLGGNVPAPFHYAIHDKAGGGIVVEFMDGKKNVYDNPVNAMTNGPQFPWHLQNLNNYTFNNVDKNTGQLGRLKLETQDAGIALAGLPSANTSEGRLVKAAFYVNYVKKATMPDEALVTLGHIINNFDRPSELTIDRAGSAGDGPRSNFTTSETTRWTVMADLTRHLFLFRTIDSLNWTMIDMNQLKHLKTEKMVSMQEAENKGAHAFNMGIFN